MRGRSLVTSMSALVLLTAAIEAQAQGQAELCSRTRENRFRNTFRISSSWPRAWRPICSRPRSPSPLSPPSHCRNAASRMSGI